eukprot:gnl/Chilomastix_caulleri/1861.p2 GENE.gnl/Chilomastix_caulleri/1861~~gnl/Chilomastix_caulleri/1861.p2  ORF type:complete len:83 (+),score=15.05 gnl/Chilomastix_caulleri/1861:238-486(+)
MIVCGVERGKARIFRTDPSGVCTEWRAVAVGKDWKNAQGLFETALKTWPEDEEGLRGLVKNTLNEMVQGGDENIEIEIIKVE